MAGAKEKKTKAVKQKEVKPEGKEKVKAGPAPEI